MKLLKGQTLIEVLAALGIAVVVITLITGAVVYSLDNAIYSKNQNLATQYAQEAMELMRKERDSNLATFGTKIGTFCLAKGKTFQDPETVQHSDTYNCEDQNVDIFKRQVNIVQNASACRISGGTYTTQVKVTVSWNSGKCGLDKPFCHNVALMSCLSSYNIVPTP